MLSKDGRKGPEGAIAKDAQLTPVGALDNTGRPDRQNELGDLAQCRPHRAARERNF